MRSVFQDIVEFATARIREELDGEVSGSWDCDVFEDEVRECTRQLGQQSLKTWAERKREQAKEQAGLCSCGHRRQIHQQRPFWWVSTFGPIAIEVPELVCPQGHGRDRPFQRLTGLHCRGKSKALQRVLTDFGAEKSFAQASEQLWEHYGVEIGPSSIRQVVLKQARRSQAVVQARQTEAVAAYQKLGGQKYGEPWLIVESDGSMIRTGVLETDPGGGLSAKGRGRKHRETLWREVRLSTVQGLKYERRWYGAVLGAPPMAGKQMFAMALLAGYGENTSVHGVGDGAPWIAQQMAEVFPRQHYLLDYYHLLEHLNGAAKACAEILGEAAENWVMRQQTRIDQGKVTAVIEECRAVAKYKEASALDQLANYLEHQREHLDYAAAREQGLPVGSGAVEGAHRHVVQARMKLPGTWWKEETVNPMLALRTLRANGWWVSFWN